MRFSNQIVILVDALNNELKFFHTSLGKE